VRQEDAKLYQQTFTSSKKEVRWYRTGHSLNCDAHNFQMKWLANHINLKKPICFNVIKELVKNKEFLIERTYWIHDLYRKHTEN
jgi:hypothetical protein